MKLSKLLCSLAVLCAAPAYADHCQTPDLTDSHNLLTKAGYVLDVVILVPIGERIYVYRSPNDSIVGYVNDYGCVTGWLIGDTDTLVLEAVYYDDLSNVERVE